MRQIPVLAFSVVVSGISLAQAQKIPLSVGHTGRDTVGQSFAFELKEAIKGSQSFRIAEDLQPSHIDISVVSVDLDTNRASGPRGIGSALSYVLTFDGRTIAMGGFYLTSGVKVCGVEVVSACARSLLPVIDHEVEKLRDSWPNFYEQLRPPQVR